MAEDTYEENILPIEIAKLSGRNLHEILHPNMMEYSFDEAEKDIGRGIITEIMENGNRLLQTIYDSAKLGGGAQNSSFKYEYKTKVYILRTNVKEQRYTDNQSFRKEIEMYRRLNTPPNSYFSKLLYSITIGSDRTRPSHPLHGSIYIFEYIPGKQLSSILGQSSDDNKLLQSEMTEEDTDYIRRNVLDIFDHLINACYTMKSHNITHRDITPFNIFVPTGKLPYLFDFDVACFSEDEKDIADSTAIGYESCKAEMFKGARTTGPPRAKSRFPLIRGRNEGFRRGYINYYTYGIWSDIYAVIYIFWIYIYPILVNKQNKIILLMRILYNLSPFALQNNNSNLPKDINPRYYLTQSRITSATNAAGYLRNNNALETIRRINTDIETAEKNFEKTPTLNTKQHLDILKDYVSYMPIIKDILTELKHLGPVSGGRFIKTRKGKTIKSLRFKKTRRHSRLNL